LEVVIKYSITLLPYQLTNSFMHIDYV
jgi:hypothetical protein